MLLNTRPHLTNWLGGHPLKVKVRVRVSLGSQMTQLRVIIRNESVMMSSMLTGRTEERRGSGGCLTSTLGVLPFRLPHPHRG